MSALKKPNRCPECSGIDLAHNFNPERWDCRKCGNTVVSRPQRNRPGFCRRCGEPEGPDRPFKPGKNLCKQCAKAIHNEWVQNNLERVRAQRRTTQSKRRRQGAVRQSIQSSPEAFIAYLVRMLGRPSNKEKMRNGRRLSERKLAILNTISITKEYMIELYHQQGGQCALSGLLMEHVLGSLKSISIDRINSSGGYVPGNVQLVCQFINKAKGSHSNEEMLAVLTELCGGVRSSL